MTRYVALLRAVNLAGRNSVAMADLRAWIADLGFADPRTLLNSGNAVFEARDQPAARIEAKLEAEARKRFKFDIVFVVRAADEMTTIVDRNPFPKEAASDPGRLLVVFTKGAIAPAKVKALQAAIVGREVVRANGAHLYAVYPDGQGRSKLTAAVIERALGVAGTGRNWNTVLKLKEMACA
ncbi:MAG TPA: DUF1697 domain-containing protein [Vicinamibacterales bacterium]|nr:DUF1697 domain-containing protein [Vicinamibacterales bacterium]